VNELHSEEQTINKPGMLLSEKDANADTDAFRAKKEDTQRFSSQIDNWLKGELPSGELFELGTTPAVLQALCKNKLPIKMSQSVMAKITGLKHNISIEDIKQIPDALADPIMVFDSATVKDAYVIFTELTDKRGNEVVCY
jgi:exoribonuclease R